MSYSLRNKKASSTPPPVSQGTTEGEDNKNDDVETKSPPPSPAATETIDDDKKSQASDESVEDLSIQDYKYWDGEQPQPSGTIASLFTMTDPNEDWNNSNADWNNCEAIAKFLYTDTEENKANKMQFDTHLVPFLAAVPGTSRKLRVVYGIGTGIGLTGITNNALETKVLALSGEHEDGITYPSMLQFPDTALTPFDMKIPSTNQFLRKLTKGSKAAHWYKYSELTAEGALPMLVPCPAKYICDSFNKDIDAAELFERLNDISDADQETLKLTLHLLRTFLAATVVKYNKADPTIYTPVNSFIQQDSNLAQKWKRDRMKTLFPTLFRAKKLVTPAPALAATPSTTVTTTNTNPNNWSPEAFLKALAGLQTQPKQYNNIEDTTTTSTEKTLGMGTFAFNLLLTLCGLTPSTSDEIINLWQQLAEKNLTKSDKLTFVRRAIENTCKWSEAKVLPLNTILTMVINRAWEGETTLSSLTSAAKGLTPFAVPCLSESEVTSQNDMAEALDAASSTTVKDHATLKLIASAPTSFDGLVKRIKRFGNLLFSVFGDISPLFMQMEDMITALDAYGEHARTTMTHQTIASILWITHLQARHYAAGAMTGDKAIKAEFTTMMNAIITKTPVLHMDTPPSLYQTSKPAPTRPNPNTPNYETPPKKPKPNEDNDRFQLVERNVMNPKLKAAMAPILNLSRLPNMGKLCRAARASAGDLFPRHKDICIRSQVLGKCFASCTHKHKKLDDSEIQTALKILESVIQNPSLINKVN